MVKTVKSTKIEYKYSTYRFHIFLIDLRFPIRIKMGIFSIFKNKVQPNYSDLELSELILIVNQNKKNSLALFELGKKYLYNTDTKVTGLEKRVDALNYFIAAEKYGNTEAAEFIEFCLYSYKCAL